MKSAGKKTGLNEVDQSYLQTQDTIFLLKGLTDKGKGQSHQAIKATYKLIRSKRETKSWDVTTNRKSSFEDFKSIVKETATDFPAPHTPAPLRQISYGRLDIKREDRTYRPLPNLLPTDKHYIIKHQQSDPHLTAPHSEPRSVDSHLKSRAERVWKWRGRNGATFGQETPEKKGGDT